MIDLSTQAQKNIRTIILTTRILKQFENNSYFRI